MLDIKIHNPKYWKFFGKYSANGLNINPNNFHSLDRNRYIQSKAHSVEALYTVLSDIGFYDREDLNTLNKFNSDTDIGVNISNIISQTGTAHTIHTDIDHGLNRITQVSINNAGAGYGSGSAGDIYNASLVSIGASVTGHNATAKITVDGNGSITAVKIMDGGSAYGIGNTLAITGVTTFAPYTQAVVEVDSIYDNVGDTVRVIGVGSESYAGYNQLHRITGVEIGAAKTVTVESASTITGFSTDVGSTLCDGSYFYSTGEAIRINTLVYNKDVGIATVTTTNRHGLRVDNKVAFTGANEALYNGSFVVNENINLNSFSVKVGVGTLAPTATGTLYSYREGYASNDVVSSDLFEKSLLEIWFRNNDHYKNIRLEWDRLEMK